MASPQQNWVETQTLEQLYAGQFTATPQWYPRYPAGISETQSKHIHVDLGLIDWKDITIINGNQKITVTPKELAIKLGLEW